MFIYIYDISLITVQKYIIELYYSKKEMIQRLECFHICDPWLHFDGFLLIFFFFLSKSWRKWVNHFRTFILLLAGPIYLFRGRSANLNFDYIKAYIIISMLIKLILNVQIQRLFSNYFFLLRVHANDAIKLSIFYHFLSWCFYQPYQRFQMYFFIDDKFYHGSSLVLEVEQYVGIFCP